MWNFYCVYDVFMCVIGVISWYVEIDFYLDDICFVRDNVFR